MSKAEYKHLVPHMSAAEDLQRYIVDRSPSPLINDRLWQILSSDLRTKWLQVWHKSVDNNWMVYGMMTVTRDVPVSMVPKTSTPIKDIPVDIRRKVLEIAREYDVLFDTFFSSDPEPNLSENSLVYRGIPPVQGKLEFNVRYDSAVRAYYGFIFSEKDPMMSTQMERLRERRTRGRSNGSCKADHSH